MTNLLERRKYERFCNNPLLKNTEILIVDDEFDPSWILPGNISAIVPDPSTGLTREETEDILRFASSF